MTGLFSDDVRRDPWLIARIGQLPTVGSVVDGESVPDLAAHFFAGQFVRRWLKVREWARRP